MTFNSLPQAEAEDLLYECFASRTWAGRVAAGRPYESVTDLIDSAESAWSGLSDAEWLRSFAAHPRIGEGGGHSPETSRREQSRVMEASSQTLTALAAENRDYEARFGHVFLIAASGRSAGEILAELRRRMKNDPALELKVAADEQRKITRLRLQQLVAQ